MTRRGVAFVLPMSALPTVESGSSSSRPLLATPTTGDSSPHYDRRISPGQKPRERPVPNLAAQVEDELLPTPDSTHGRTTTRTSRLLPGAIDDLLPTPNASDHKGATTPDAAKDWEFRGTNLPEAIQRSRALLPTPQSADSIRGRDYSKEDRPSSGGDDLPSVIRSRGEATRPRSPDGSESSDDPTPRPSTIGDGSTPPSSSG